MTAPAGHLDPRAAALARVRLERERRRRLAAADGPRSVLAWAARHRRPRGQAFSLDRFAPLEQIYDDDHPHVVIIKAAQRGISEYAVNLTMFALERGASVWSPGRSGLNVGYLFPTKQAVSDFSKDRVAKLKLESEALRRLFSGYDDVTFKQVGASTLYMRGAQSENDLHSFAADILIRDEFDRQDERARELAEKRLGESDIARILDLSTPTLPEAGIDAAYAASDQRVWEVICPACERWGELPFLQTVRLDGEPSAAWLRWDPERIAEAAAAVHCPSCDAPIDHCGPGRWRALRPERRMRRGYRVPWYGFPFAKIHATAARLASPDPTVVTEAWRSDLGVAYVPKGARVDAQMVARAGVPLPAATWHDVTMGVDVGAVFHYRVSARSSADGRRYVVDAGRVPEWADLSALLARWGVRRCVVDAHPELHACKAWQARHPGVVVRALYPTEKALDGRLYRERGDEDDEEEGVVSINRTMAMDGLYAALSRGPDDPEGERWAAPLVADHEVRGHLIAPVRVILTDDRGQSRATWTHTAPDHLFHASVYDRIAARLMPSEGVFF